MGMPASLSLHPHPTSSPSPSPSPSQRPPAHQLVIARVNMGSGFRCREPRLGNASETGYTHCEVGTSRYVAVVREPRWTLRPSRTWTMVLWDSARKSRRRGIRTHAAFPATTGLNSLFITYDKPLLLLQLLTSDVIARRARSTRVSAQHDPGSG
jgi:hypothetical protein